MQDAKHSTVGPPDIPVHRAGLLVLDGAGSSSNSLPTACGCMRLGASCSSSSLDSAPAFCRGPASTSGLLLVQFEGGSPVGLRAALPPAVGWVSSSCCSCRQEMLSCCNAQECASSATLMDDLVADTY